ncbi:hypothetical protein A3770_02p13400 [Chloropicon primus]|uniref:Uncharacterized protein n=1 Tax=Chloropicon primus TaxID=1764295 RepID=A0A5B8MHI0_9CHLO|nr:hypothetical protein A3770_02p13400 [Chloropicon primus]|eukprot:QDZ18822.1 hypothetical protein A3770_02p13400 [Chloropicon primus]
MAEEEDDGRYLEEEYRVVVVDGALSRDVYELAEREAEKLGDCPNYWIPREKVVVEDGARGLGEWASVDLFRRIAGELLEGEEWEGAEYWTQVYTGGRGLEFHFDKDESKVETKGIFQFPILSSVIYLTEGQAPTSAASKVPKQSPTIVVDQVYQGQGGGGEPRKSVLSYPRANRVLIFDGRLAHGVLDSLNVTCRKTLLINFWREKPERLARVSQANLSEFGLGESPKRSGEIEDVPVVPTPRRMVRRGLEGEEEEGEVILLDDVCKAVPEQEFRDSLCISVRHPKHVLYPIEATEGMEPCTLGAFVREDGD